jgi:hypothetical protein
VDNKLVDFALQRQKEGVHFEKKIVLNNMILLADLFTQINGKIYSDHD